MNNADLTLPLVGGGRTSRRASTSHRQLRLPSRDELDIPPATVKAIDLDAENSAAPRWVSVALREKFSIDGYTPSDFRSDVLAGFVVGMVAIPLGMALGVATGVTPQLGLYTVIVGGFVTALLGGSRFQVSGPTAAFVVILEPIVAEYGVGGLLIAGLMSGIIVVFMGLTGMGKLIHYMPDTVKFGFTSGIAVTIGAQQLKDFLGLQLPTGCTHFFDILIAVMENVRKISIQSVLVSSATLCVIIMFPKISSRIPAPLVAITIMTVVIFVLENVWPTLEISTIGTKFSYTQFDGTIGHGIPPEPPLFSLPWAFPTFSGEMVWDLIPSAIKIALLGSIESLLSAVIADGMAEQKAELSTRHDPDSELVAIGLANIITPFFGGIPATGAIARTATNIKFGATSPVSAIVHSVFALLCVVALAPAMSRVPMGALAALLLFVAYNMGEPEHFMKLLRNSPRDDKIVLLSCFVLTVVFDMVIGVFGGLVVAAALFAKQMTHSVSLRRGIKDQATLSQMSGKELLVYELNGPLFFGTAKSMQNMLEEMARDQFVSSVVLIMDNVPVMDVSGALSMVAGVDRVLQSHKTVFLVGIRKQPLKLIRKHLPESRRGLHVMDSMAALHEAVNRVHDIPSTPHLRWAAVPAGRQQVQGDMTI
jgi:sulfate permease, SulP family